jgi:uncharacterized protein (TIGR00369 family)
MNMERPMTRTAEEWMAYGRSVLAAQSFSQLLGTQLIALTAGSVEMMLSITEQLKQQHGFVHGGVLSYLADNALTFAGGTALGVPVVTAEFKVNYLRPAVGECLIARASAVHVGKTQSVCRCDVFVVKDGQEKICAVAQGTIAALGSATEKL